MILGRTPGTVTAVTPIKPGAALDLLGTALATALASLGATFQWRYACAPQDYLAVRELGDLLPDAAGYVTTSKNVAATRNRLAALGDGEHLLQLDADDAYVPGGLAQMRWVLDTDPAVVAAHGRHWVVDPTGGQVLDVPPTWWYEFDGHVALPGQLAHRRAEIAGSEEVRLAIPGYVACYPQHPGAGLFRRAAVLAAGGWDEVCGNYHEDTVLLAKLARHHPWHLAPSTPVLLYRRGQPTSLSARTLTDAQLGVYDMIAEAHEYGWTPPAPPFPPPPTTPLESP